MSSWARLREAEEAAGPVSADPMDQHCRSVSFEEFVAGYQPMVHDWEVRLGAPLYPTEPEDVGLAIVDSDRDEEEIARSVRRAEIGQWVFAVIGVLGVLALIVWMIGRLV